MNGDLSSGARRVLLALLTARRICEKISERSAAPRSGGVFYFYFPRLLFLAKRKGHILHRAAALPFRSGGVRLRTRLYAARVTCQTYGRGRHCRSQARRPRPPPSPPAPLSATRQACRAGRVAGVETCRPRPPSSAHGRR